MGNFSYFNTKGNKSDEKSNSKGKTEDKSNTPTQSSEDRGKEDAEGNFYAESPDINDDIRDLSQKEKQSIDTNPVMAKDNEELNKDIEEEQSSVPSSNLSGNAMSEWKSGNNYGNTLDGFGRLEHKQGVSENDHMSKFFAYTKDWHIQDTIDHELATILRINPNMKVKFMRVNDKDIYDMFLVVDYDNNVNKGITLIHNNDNGVIVSGGKKYLVIGTGGYARTNNTAKETYDNLWGNKLWYNSKKFFKENPDEKYHVVDGYYTEIVPGSIIPGYRVKQLEDDSEGNDSRNILDMLKDPKRNPMRLTLKSLGWGIQYTGKFATYNAKAENVMNPNLSGDKRAGNVYVLFPAANGKYFPAHINDCRYRDLREGSLKDDVDRLLNQLCDFDINNRKAAIIKLSSSFVFKQKNNTNSNVGDCILTNKFGWVTFIKEGNKICSIKITDDLDRSKIFDAFQAMNPRVRISLSQIQDEQSLQKLSDAGALTTDLAELALAGSSYQVYGVTPEGKILKPQESKTPNSNKDNTDKKDKEVHEHRIKLYSDDNSNKYYVYNDLTGKYYQEGKELDEENDSSLIKQLNYIRCIDNYQFAVRKNKDEYYIVNNNEDHPLVIKIDRSSHKVEELNESDSRKVIEDYKKSQADSKRQINADREIKEKDNKEESSPETGLTDNNDHSNKPEEKPEFNLFEDGIIDEDQGVESEGNIYDANDVTDENQDKGNDSSLSSESTEETSNTEKENKDKSETKKPPVDTSQLPFDEEESTPVNTISFSKLYESNYRQQIKKVLMKKGLYNRDIKKMTEKLKALGIEVDNIDNSKEGILAWVKTLRNCR